MSKEQIERMRLVLFLLGFQLALLTASDVLARGGNLRIVTPPGVRLFVDGKFVAGTDRTCTQVLLLNLEPGCHRLKAFRKHFRTRTGTFHIRPAKTKKINLRTGWREPPEPAGSERRIQQKKKGCRWFFRLDLPRISYPEYAYNQLFSGIGLGLGLGLNRNFVLDLNLLAGFGKKLRWSTWLSLNLGIRLEIGTDSFRWMIRTAPSFSWMRTEGVGASHGGFGIALSSGPKIVSGRCFSFGVIAGAEWSSVSMDFTWQVGLVWEIGIKG
jgi:hypothetical protein